MLGSHIKAISISDEQAALIYEVHDAQASSKSKQNTAISIGILVDKILTKTIIPIAGSFIERL